MLLQRLAADAVQLGPRQRCTAGGLVDGLEIGQRVVASTPGVWAAYVTLPASSVVPVDDSIPDEVAAQMIAMPMSALTLLDSLGLDEGDWFVQNAANGAVGRMLAQIAAPRGVNVLGLVRRPDAVAQLAAIGIERVVATDDDDWRARVAEVTGGAALRAGVDSVGGRAAGDLLSLVADGGTLIAFGAMASTRLDLDVSDILFRGVSVKGFWGATHRVAPERRGELFAELRARLADGTLTLPVAAVHDLADVTDAVRASGEAGRDGKVLLRP